LRQTEIIIDLLDSIKLLLLLWNCLIKSTSLSTKMDISPKIFKSIKSQILSYKNSVKSFIRENKHKLANIIDTNYQLGLFHLNANNINDAEFRFRLVLYFDPEHYEATYQLSKCLIAKKKIRSAEKKLNKVLEVKKDFAEAKYLLGILGKQNDVDSIPLSVIQAHYDDIAHDFNRTFNSKRGYKLSEYMSESLCNNIADYDKKYKVLDLGCGTGKCSEALSKKLNADSIIGVDISEKMLEEAQKCSQGGSPLFDKLVNVNYIDFLNKTKSDYDIILAGTSLHFIKDLQETLSLICKNLQSKGYLIFSVEKSYDKNLARINRTYENFCYSEKYIKESIKKSQLNLIELDEISISNDKSILIATCRK